MTPNETCSIRDHDDLMVVRRQLALAEDALASLRRGIRNDKNFAIYSQGYVAQIDALRAEIDAYLGLAHVPARLASMPASEVTAGTPIGIAK